MPKLKILIVLAAAVAVTLLPMASQADEATSGLVPEEVPTHGAICYTHANWPYVHVCVP